MTILTDFGASSTIVTYQGGASMPLKTAMDPKTGKLKTYSISAGGSIVTDGIGGPMVSKLDQPRKVREKAKELMKPKVGPGFRKP